MYWSVVADNQGCHAPDTPAGIDIVILYSRTALIFP